MEIIHHDSAIAQYIQLQTLVTYRQNAVIFIMEFYVFKSQGFMKMVCTWLNESSLS